MTLVGARLGTASVFVRSRAGPSTLLVNVMAGIILERWALVLEPQHIGDLEVTSPWGKVEAVSEEELTLTETL